MEKNIDSRTSRATYFDFERLEVYKKAIEYLTLVQSVSTRMPRGSASTRDQLDRAADSIVLNIAEGAGKRRGSRDRARFYGIASGSSKESAAAWDILKIREYASMESYREARGLLLQIVSMLQAMMR